MKKQRERWGSWDPESHPDPWRVSRPSPKKERSLSFYKKLKTVDHRRLDTIEQEKTTENFSLFGYNPAKNNEEDKCKMASKVGEPWQNMIKNW